MPSVIFFLLGICALQFCTKIPNVAFQLIIITASSIFWCVLHYSINHKPNSFSIIINTPSRKLFRIIHHIIYKISWAVLIASIGFAYASFRANAQLAKSLPIALEKKTFSVIGTIVSLPEVIEDADERSDERYRFEFLIKQTVPDQIWRNPGKVRLSWSDPNEIPRPGQGWQFTVKLKRPRMFANPGSFDSERHFFANHWVASGYVCENYEKSNIPVKLYDGNASPWLQWDLQFELFREKVRDFILNTLKTSPVKGLMAALMSSARETITTDQWTTLQDTGTNHLMSMPGLHASLAASIGYFAIQWIWRLLPSFFLRIPAIYAGACVALFIAILYGILASFQRAVIMVAAFMLTHLLRRRISHWRSYSIALVFMLLWDPASILSSGFWLSFGAVGWIFYAMRDRLGVGGIWWKWGRVQWVVCLGLMPITLIIFHKASFIAPLVNIIAIPIVSFLVVPLALLSITLFTIPFPGFIKISQSCLKLSDHILSLLWKWLQYCQALPHATWHSIDLPGYIFILATVGMMWILAPRGFPGRPLGIVLLLPLTFSKPEIIPDKMVWITVLDVGQGLSVVVETTHHCLVYDTGPKLGPNYDMGERVLEPYLRTRGIKHIDTLVISHGDNDHVGGLHSLIKKMPIHDILTSEQQLVEKISHQVSHPCYAGKAWKWDGVDFEIIHPETLHTKKRNDHCCVLRIKTGNKSVLLTGDIEVYSEQHLVEKWGKRLQSTVLLVPHHGSKTSSSIPFIQSVDPSVAIIPAGHLNQYGHPRPEIVERYHNLGIKLFDTIKGGAIRLILDNKNDEMMASQYRIENKRYWHSD